MCIATCVFESGFGQVYCNSEQLRYFRIGTDICIYCILVIHLMFLLMRNLSKCITWLNIPQLKLGNVLVIFLKFQIHTCCKKFMKDNKHNIFHLAWQYVRILVLAHYLFLRAHSFPWALLSQLNCSLLWTDNVCRQISDHIFVPNGGYCLYIHHMI